MISFFTTGIRYSITSKGHLRQWLSAAASAEGHRIQELNIILCSDEYLYRLNVGYLKHRTLTDIITFDNSEQEGIISGELYISLDRIRDNAKLLKIRVKDELHRVMVHGLLHLCGYSDKTKSAKKTMTGREDHYLSMRIF